MSPIASAALPFTQCRQRERALDLSSFRALPELVLLRTPFAKAVVLAAPARPAVFEEADRQVAGRGAACSVRARRWPAGLAAQRVC